MGGGGEQKKLLKKKKQKYNKKITDHKALATWFTQELPENRRRARWILKMSQYNFTIKHRQGKSLAHVDYLSRNPISKVVTFGEKTNPWEEILPEVEKFKEFHLETELWRPVITKVEGIRPRIRGEARTLTNEVWYTHERLRPKTWENSRRVSEQPLRRNPKLQLATKPRWET